MSSDISAVVVAAKYRALWLQEKAALDSMVTTAAHDKSYLPDNYWRGEYVARAKLAVAQALIETLDE